MHITYAPVIAGSFNDLVLDTSTLLPVRDLETSSGNCRGRATTRNRAPRDQVITGYFEDFSIE